MPPYLHRRLFRGWDWFTPRAIHNLPLREQERLIREAWEIVLRHPRYWLMGSFLPMLGCLGLGFVVLSYLFLNLSSAIYSVITLAVCVQMAITIVWQRRRLQEALRQKLLDAGLRPAFCFGCGHDLQSFEGNECPACDAPLLRKADSPPEKS